MMKRLLLALIVAFVLGGCASLNQFPVVSNDYKQALNDMDAEYSAAVNQVYGPERIAGNGAQASPSAGPAFVPLSVDEQKRIRRVMMERRMAVIDANFKMFQTGLVKEKVQSDFGIAVAGVVIGGWGSLAAETTSKILSAVSGGLAGAQAAYGKAALYDKAMSALLAQMQAGRKAIAAKIYQSWDLGLDKYPMWMARMDLDAYYFAGSIPGAILGTAADAKVKEAEADAILLRAITKEGATEEIFAKMDELNSRIAKLSGAKAKKLVTAIENGAEGSKSFNDAKEIFDDQYTDEVRSTDTNGTAALEVLPRAVIHSIRSPKEAKEWENLIDTIEKQ